jgi:hypothetical protein
VDALNVLDLGKQTAAVHRLVIGLRLCRIFGRG